MTFIRRGRFDAVQTFLYRANVLGVVAARLVGVPRVVASVRGTASWNPSSRGGHYALVERLALARADAVVCNAEAVAAFVRDRGTAAHRIRVVPNGLVLNVPLVSPEAVKAVRGRCGAGKQTVLVGVVARADPQKDLPTFLSAAAAASAEAPHLRFAVVGGGPLETEVRAAAEFLGISDCVTFFGPIKDVRAHLEAIDVAVLPSCEGEGMSNFLIEAMAASKPVIATMIGGAAELVVDGETGRLVPPGDAVRMADAIRVLADDAELRTRYGAAGCARVRRLCDPERMLAAFRELYGPADPI
jgi:glycosyltransferase involved in cell wall biosynthesis